MCQEKVASYQFTTVFMLQISYIILKIIVQ